MNHAFFALLSFALAAFFQSAQGSETGADSRPLDDLMTPDEIAEELGLPLRSDGLELAPGFMFREGAVVPFAIRPPEFSSIESDVPDHEREKVVIIINKAVKGATAQSMIVYQDGIEQYRFDVSTGREKMETAKSGKRYLTATPVGYFRPTWLRKLHMSKTWEAPMPWSIFFKGGVAIHATTPNFYDQLGSRASGGCVRLRDEDAKAVFDLVVESGRGPVELVERSGKIRVRDGEPVLVDGYRTLIIVRNIED